MANTVESIQGGIKETVDAALNEGLMGIQATVDSLTVQTQSIATGEDVDAINESLDQVEEDLTDLLASNNIFTGDLVINSESTLEFAQELKDKVRIINGNVIIEANTEMDADALQGVVDKIRTITKDLTIRAANSSAPSVVLDSLSGVGSIKVAQSGSISFGSLKSAKNIVFGNNYESKLNGVVNFGALTQVSSFETGEIGSDAAYTVGGTITKNGIVLDKASGINLGSLPYYTPRSLTLVADDDAELNLAALKSVDANAKERSYTVSIKGAKEFNVPGLTVGKLTVEDVATVTLAAFKGDITIYDGVENVTMGALAKDFVVSSNDLNTVDLTADASDKKIDLTGAEGLLTANIAGKIKTVVFSGNADLETLTISAAVEALTIHDTALEEATLGYTNANLAEKASLVVTNNEDLTSFSADNVDGLATLTITNNDELETISFAALKKAPTKDGKAIVTIGGAGASDANALNATDINQDAVGSADGTFITDSGIDGLKEYLQVVAKNTASELKVFFDTADDFTDGTTELTNLKIGTAAHVAHLTVMNRGSSSGASKSKRAFLIDPIPAAGLETIMLNGNTLNFTTVNATTAGYLAAIDTDVKNSANTYGATLTTSAYGKPEASIVFPSKARTAAILSSVTSATTVATAQSVSLQLNQKDKSDAEYKVTIYLSTAAITDLTASTIGADGKTHVGQLTVTGSTTVASITDALAAAFPTGQGVNDGAYTVTSSGTTSGTIHIAAKDVSPKYHGRGIKVTSTESLGLGNAIINLATTGDDTLLGTLPVIIFESTASGDSILDGGLSTIGNPGDAAGTTAGTLTYANGTELTKNETGDQDQNDSPDHTNYGVESSSATGTTDRSAWL